VELLPWISADQATVDANTTVTPANRQKNLLHVIRNLLSCNLTTLKPINVPISSPPFFDLEYGQLIANAQTLSIYREMAVRYSKAP
jgi:hypothetical protein